MFCAHLERTRTRRQATTDNDRLIIIHNGVVLWWSGAVAITDISLYNSAQ